MQLLKSKIQSRYWRNPNRTAVKTRLAAILVAGTLFVMILMIYPDSWWPVKQKSTGKIVEVREMPPGGTVPTSDSTNRDLEYFYFFPAIAGTPAKLPVLIVVGGLNAKGHHYVTGHWREFAKENGFAIVSPSFCFNEADWQRQRSYQFPAVWSGQAMNDILDSLAKKGPIDKNRLYLFGHSAGAQFVHRFALLYPERCRAVAAHAPGGVTLPEATAPVRFLIAVGLNDTPERVACARRFAKACGEHGIQIDLKEFPGIGHQLTGEAIQMSFDFFARVKKEEQKPCFSGNGGS
ncbi:MAG TPA: PHB depolymerase family esterase [Chitinivibrionales bacterium]|nr:PHB depolymerase family esterase [Chitinivibrionales bacterium]